MRVRSFSKVSTQNQQQSNNSNHGPVSKNCALVNILTEVSITEEDCNDSVSCYSIGAGRTNSLSLLHLLLCHLFVSNFSVNRKGLFRPVPICDGAFFTIQCAYTDQSAARRQQSRPYFQRPTFFKLASDVSGG